MTTLGKFALALCAACHVPLVCAQQPSGDPFPVPIEAEKDVIAVDFVEFAQIPFAADGEAPRMMSMVPEPGGQRLFLSTMRGMLHGLGDGGEVQPYLDIDDARWGVQVQHSGRERGVQSIAFHPQFNERGRPGYGRFYTYTDTRNVEPPADFVPSGEDRTHDTVLLEWTAKDPAAAAYDGGAPREILRVANPFANHNGGQIGFNPLAMAGSADYGLLYVGLADGGSGGDPLNLSQDMSSAFGKLLRIDPLGANGPNGRYGIPADNPFAGRAGVRREIYASGVRNPQRFAWDSRTGVLYVADIGQNQVEEISPVSAGANLGWNVWEGSYRFISRQAVDVGNPRGDPAMTWPVVEFDHVDPLFQRQVAITGVAVLRETDVPALRDLLIFGDNPSGEIFYVSADRLPQGGQDAIRRIRLKSAGTSKTLLELIREKNTAAGDEPATRADLRFGIGPRGELFLLNKADGVVRLVVPQSAQ